ncbi:MAG: AAA-associated domain-containing protein [Nitrososphaerota archaeon]|nr:AAA-associated domain-containing protein [Nitrososphaerota archaeon]MDG7023332.1 AAA-associated domain-containing protein [Nitrososphaerota archaeon]
MAEPHRPLPTALMMPGNVRGGQVISLVEITGSIGGKVDAPKLADEMGADIAVLLPVLDAAEMLGLVRSEKGDVHLTEIGLKFQKTSKNKLRLLKDRLATIEPFRTALELASKGKPVTADQVAESLQEIGLKWHYQPEMNEALIQALLIHWAIYAGLLRYDGKSGKFQKN